MLKTQQYSTDSHLLLNYLRFTYVYLFLFLMRKQFDDSEGIKDGSSHVRKAYGLRSKCFWLLRFVAMKMNNKSLLLPSMPYFTRKSLPQDRKIGQPSIRTVDGKSDFQEYFTHFVVPNECRRMSIYTNCTLFKR